MSETWDSIVAAALVGAERRTPHFEPEGSAALLERLDSADREGHVLRAAAVQSLYLRAGQRFDQDDRPLPAPALPDQRPTCSGASIAHLRRVIETPAPDALREEWLRLLVGRGLRAPHAYLPTLLQWLIEQPHLYDLIVDSLDQRGWWLARQNPDWRAITLVEVDAELFWAESNRVVRLAAVRWLRRRDPVAGRALVEKLWAQQNVADRRSLLAALQDKLSPEDDTFLMVALDDKQSQIRAEAAKLLSALPSSAFSQRMKTRIAQHVQFLQTGGQLTVEVRLPEDLDDELTTFGFSKGRDDIDYIVQMTPPQTWLLKLISLTPLEHWQHPPPDILRAIALHPLAKPLLEGIKEAAAHQRNVTWLHALIETDLMKPTYIPPAPLQALVSVEMYDLAVKRLLELSLEQVSSGVLVRPLSPVGVPQFLKFLQDMEANGTSFNYEILVMLIPTDMLANVIRQLEAMTDENSSKRLRQLTETLRFRHEMNEEFAR